MTTANPTFPITVYGKPDRLCFGCKKSKELLQTAGIPYQYFDLTAPENEPLLDELKAQGITSAPYIETPDDKWTGLNKDKLDTAIASYQAAIGAAA